MHRVDVTPEALHLRGALRRRTLYFEELAAVSAEADRLRLALHDGEAVTIRLADGEAGRLAAEVGAVLAPADVAADVPALRATVEAQAARRGFAAAPFVEGLLRSAAALGASDLHAQPDLAGGHALTLRVDGVVHALGTLERGRALRVIGRLKILAGVQVHRDDVPQEGRAPLPGGSGGFVRLGFAPGVGGEAVTIRLFDRLKGEARLAALGFSAGVQAGLDALLGAPHGVLLFAGPSASGKTTTLYTALRALLARAEGSRRALTVEDPVEYRLPGVVQLEPDPGRGLAGADLLRAALRQDADVLVVGEARDAESVALMLRAGLTGHLVLGTVHAGNAAEAWARLQELGAEPAVLGRAVRGILAQRLVRRRCCPAGCPACDHTGYRGRIALGELRTPDDAWLAGAPRDDALRADAARLLAAGLTDAAEVERVLGR